VDERWQRVREQNNVDERTTNYLRGLDSKKLWENMKELPPEQRRNLLLNSIQSGRMDFPAFEKFLDVVKVEAKNMTPLERGLFADPVESRAKTIVARMDTLKPEKVADDFRRMIDVGVISDATAKEMAKIYAKRGYGIVSLGQNSAGRNPAPSESVGDAMDRVFGVPRELPRPPENKGIGDAMDRVFGASK
jgi:hypothetical protein